MDLNTNLKEDKFLFPENHDCRASNLIVKDLNKSGIQTVNEFINCNSNQFSDDNRHYLNALIQILKYNYLNERLENDDLFDYKYLNDEKEIIKMVKDLRKLGFGRSVGELFSLVKTYVRLKREPYFTVEQILRADDKKEIIQRWNHMRLLRIRYFGSANLEKFYLNYILQRNQKVDKNKILKLK